MTPAQRHGTVIFAGAGASTAVNPKKYPTTKEFFDRLRPEVAESALFKACVDYLKTRTPDAVIDIEMVLWIIEELRTFAKLLNQSDSVPGWFARSNRLSAALQLNQSFEALLGVMEQAENTARPLVERINRQVYDYYAEVPAPADLKRNWTELLHAVVRSFRDSIDIFTTNYDVVIEKAVRELEARDIGNPKIRTGADDSDVYRRLDQSLWSRDREPNSRSGLLTKLHGSVHWSQHGEHIHVGDPGYKGSEDRQVILYPGFKGVPDREPFVTFHAYLERQLLEARRAIFIGFAFRDVHLNDIILRTLTPGCSVVVLNPAANISVPLPSEMYHHVQEPFDEKAVTAAIKFLKDRENAP